MTLVALNTRLHALLDGLRIDDRSRWLGVQKEPRYKMHTEVMNDTVISIPYLASMLETEGIRFITNTNTTTMKPRPREITIFLSTTSEEKLKITAWKQEHYSLTISLSKQPMHDHTIHQWSEYITCHKISEILAIKNTYTKARQAWRGCINKLGRNNFIIDRAEDNIFPIARKRVFDDFYIEARISFQAAAEGHRFAYTLEDDVDPLYVPSEFAHSTDQFISEIVPKLEISANIDAKKAHLSSFCEKQGITLQINEQFRECYVQWGASREIEIEFAGAYTWRDDHSMLNTYASLNFRPDGLENKQYISLEAGYKEMFEAKIKSMLGIVSDS